MIEIDGKPVGELSYRIKGDNVAYPGWKICDFSYQNQGYGPKIIMMLFEFPFTDEAINSKVPIEKIVWDRMFENKRAQYVYENKIGARKVGIRKDCWKDQIDKWRTAIDYELSKEEFLMLGNKGFDLWADGYDKSVQLSGEDNEYPFAGYKDVLNTIYNIVHRNSKRKNAFS